MDQPHPVLRHALDKVRYFRNVLYGDDLRVRIIIGDEASQKVTTLKQALSDVEMGSSLANQLCVLNPIDPIPWLPVKEPKDKSAAILVYFRWTRPGLDPFVEALIDEYGESNCEIVVFERDPMWG